MKTSWFKPAARAGYAARGVIYGTVAVLTMVTAFLAGASDGPKDAISTIARQPFGKILLVLLLAGLLGYVAWRLIQSLLDTDDHGWGIKGLAIRLGLLASAGTYSVLSLFVLALLGPGSSDGGSGGAVQAALDGVTGVLGAWPVFLAMGFAFLGIGGAHFWKAIKGKYEDHLEADAAAMALIHPISVTGLSARGLVFVILAFLIFSQIVSGVRSPQSKPGLEDALNFLQDMPFGSVLMFLMGAGLGAFALYSFTLARWRRINIDDI